MHKFFQKTCAERHIALQKGTFFGKIQKTPFGKEIK